MDDVRYPEVVACLRAPRFVMAYRLGSDWVYRARRVIQSLSRVWAGAGAVILPAERAADGDPDLLGLIRSYDPDIIAGHVPLVEDETHLDRAAEQGDDGNGARDPTVLRHIITQAIDVGPWDDIARLAGCGARRSKAFIKTPGCSRRVRLSTWRGRLIRIRTSP